MRNYFIYAGEDSRDYGVYISGSGTYNSPAREYQNISIPGRDGDLLSTETRLENVGLTYPAFIYDNTRQNLAAFRSFLLSVVGYGRLIDTYHPDEYRMAVFKGVLNVEMLPALQAGEFNITFDCKPQRYLLTGETPVAVSSSDSLTNPTPFSARPVIRVSGAGTVVVGSVTVTITAHPYAYIDIDCEMMDCYHGADNCNAYVSFSGNDFPVLPAGSTGITYSGPSAVTVTPRWWRV